MRYLLVLLALAACAPATPVLKPVAVDIPIAVPCPMATVAQPDFALSHVAQTDDAYVKTKAALIELDQRKAYEAELEERLGACR
jgi:hypothetical protein